jgi:hypothetical protein
MYIAPFMVAIYVALLSRDVMDNDVVHDIKKSFQRGHSIALNSVMKFARRWGPI